uniref:Uncharacterized protein n=1 Tax=Oryza punctata TaxID=4537 RepID=A0A0E0MPU4_ORYPU
MFDGEGFFVDVQANVVIVHAVVAPAGGGDTLRLLVQEKRDGGRRRTDDDGADVVGGDGEDDGDFLRPYEPIIICCVALLYRQRSKASEKNAFVLTGG